MPSFTSKLPDLRHSGPICDVKIWLSDPAIKQLQERGESPPEAVEVKALIDTGASGTAINPDVVERLGLIPRGIVQIATPSSPAHPCNVYDASLWFPNRVALSLTQVIETSLEGQTIQCLIGRDVLAHGILIYNGYSDTFSLSF